MKPFTKKEAFGVGIIFLAVVLVTFYNLQIALRRSRDSQRKQDLGVISDALHKYNEDFGFFPPSENGKIKACKASNFDDVFKKLTEAKSLDRDIFFEGLRACEWSKDPLANLLDTDYPAYIPLLPGDAMVASGVSYYYLSNSRRFQLYSFLEGEDEEGGYDSGIVERGLPCGSKVCSFGKSSIDTPLDISIEDYEEELNLEVRP